MKISNTSTRNKTKELQKYELKDWLGKFTSAQFDLLVSISGAHQNSKTSKAAKAFLVNGSCIYTVKEESEMSYSVINRAIWSLVKRHLTSIQYSDCYKSITPIPKSFDIKLQKNKSDLMLCAQLAVRSIGVYSIEMSEQLAVALIDAWNNKVIESESSMEDSIYKKVGWLNDGAKEMIIIFKYYIRQENAKPYRKNTCI